MVEVTYKSINEIADWIKNVPFETNLSFSSNTKEDIDAGLEYLEWFGLRKTKLFEGKSIEFGFYGKGIICAHYYNEDEEIIDLLKVFFSNDVSFGYNDMDTLITVDKEEWEQK